VFSANDICCKPISPTELFANGCTDTATYHEVALDEFQLVGQTLLESVVGGTLDLVIVVVQTGNVSTGELGNLAGRAADTTTNVEDLHSLLDADAVGKIVLVTGNGLAERFAVGEAAEVERLAPAVFVQIGGEVVIARYQLALVDMDRET
jgi:hypothetical protein